jgi:hypothetical protein
MAAMRKLNDFSKRARLVKMHSIILNEIIRQGPSAYSICKIKFLVEIFNCYNSGRHLMGSQIMLPMG